MSCSLNIFQTCVSFSPVEIIAPPIFRLETEHSHYIGLGLERLEMTASFAREQTQEMHIFAILGEGRVSPQIFLQISEESLCLAGVLQNKR